MALIGKIRENTTLVLLFIGGGILLFVLSDIMNSGSSGPIGPAEAVMARVGEVEIERNEFERTLSVNNTGGNSFRNRDNLWNFYLSEGLIKNETERLGLGVSKEELDQLTYGPRYSPVIRQTYGDPQTGQINTQFLNQIRTQIEDGSVVDEIQEGRLNPNFVPIWKYQNRQVTAQRLQEKLTALVSKAMYAPSWLAQDYANAEASSRSVAVVKVPFDELDNDEVELTDADLEAYVNEYRSSFNNLEETRRLAYVSFDVEPSPTDVDTLRAQLREIAAEWETLRPREDSLFALSNNGTFTGNYETAERISAAIADEVFALNVGEVYGPYEEGNALKLAKLVDRRTMADSVAIRRIVRNANTPSQFTEANRLLDSLQNVLEATPRKFAELADEFNRDPRSLATSGEITNITPGQVARPVNQLLFIDGEVGELYKVETATNVQLIEILRRSASTTPRAKVGYIVENIVPSKDTELAARAKAEEFLSGMTTLEEMRSAAESAGLNVVVTPPLGIGAFSIAELGDGQDVRNMLCWAFGASEGEVSGFVYTFQDPQLFYENKYVVVGLEQTIPEGVTPIAAVREQLEPVVRDRIKGRKLAEAIAGKDLSVIAGQYDVSVDTLRSVNPTLRSLPSGVGSEPKVLAAAASVATNQLSEPIVGNGGVFVIKPLSDAPEANSGNLPGARQNINSDSRIYVGNNLLNAMRVDTEIEDQRVATECN